MHAHLAAHQLGQTFAYRQAQPGAAVAARGGCIGLLKTLKEPVHLLGREADARVPHFKAQQYAPGILLLHPHGDADFAVLSEFDGVVGIIDENLSQPQGVAHQVGRHIGGHVAHQLKALGACLVPHHIHHAFQHAVEHKGMFFHLQPARLDLGKIEDVVDHAQQMLARLLDLAHIVVLPGAQPRFERQVRHADDGVHGCADLMALVRQKTGLEGGGLLRQFLGQTQALLGLLAVGDIHKRANGATRRAIGLRKTMQPEKRVVHFAIGIGQVHLLVHRLRTAQRCLRIPIEPGPFCLRQKRQVEHGLADQVFAAHAKGFFVGGIEPDVAPLRILVEQRHGNGVNQGLLKTQLLRHLRFQLFLVVDIDIDPNHTQGFSLCVADDAGGLQKPAHLAIGSHDAPGISQVGFCACNALIKVRTGALTVIGMQTGQPAGPSAGLGARRQADHGHQLVRPDDGVALQIDVVHAHLASLLGQLQPLCGLLHGHFGLPGLADVLNHPDRSRLAALQLQPAPRQSRNIGAAVQTAQRRFFSQCLPLHQPWHHACNELLGTARAAEQCGHALPQQTSHRAAHQLYKRRVELFEQPIANQQDGWCIVENGGLLLQQLVEQTLAALHLLLCLHALGDILVQAHHANALAKFVKQGGQRDLVVVQAAVAPPIDKLSLPRPARQQRGPHLLVGGRRRLAAGNDGRFFAAHVRQGIARVALILRIDPVDESVAIGDHHGHGAALQRGAQHMKPLACCSHAPAADQHVPHQQAQQAQRQQGRASHLQPQGQRRQGADVVQRQQLPASAWIFPVQVAPHYRMGHAIDVHLGRIGRKRQRRGHAVVKMVPHLP